jgi:hypothetical protein
MPEGSTSGSKLTSRQLPGVSLDVIDHQVPASTCRRLLGQGFVASPVGSAASPVVTTRCHWTGACPMRDHSVEEVALVLSRLGAAGSRANEATAAIDHRTGVDAPGGINETESVEAVVAGIGEAGRERVALEDLQRPGGFRMADDKILHSRWVRFSGRGVPAARLAIAHGNPWDF